MQEKAIEKNDGAGYIILQTLFSTYKNRVFFYEKRVDH